MSIMNIGIMSRSDYAKRTLAIVKGKHKVQKSEPRIWFESLKSLSQVLSNENRELLKLIVTHQPQSLGELEKLSGRQKSNLSRTLKTLARFGIVELPKLEGGKLAPVVKATEFRIEFGIDK